MAQIRHISSFLVLTLISAMLFGCVPIQAPIPAEAVPVEAGSEDLIAATFVCPDGTRLETLFDNEARTVTVTLPDGPVTLPQVPAASGARYSDGTITFWNTGNEALVEINDEIVFEACVDRDDVEVAIDPEPDNVIEATFVCPDGTELDAVFDNDAQTVTVTLPDGTVTLPQTISGSGARYSDDTITFWNKGDEAMVEVNGEIIFEGCIAQ